jgi:hypothetical protein
VKTAVYLTLIAALLALYVRVLFEVLHANVSQGYRDYYIARTTTDWKDRFVHYPATPEQGIVFNKEGLPAWVDHTYGLSYREDGGRWTDQNLGRTSGLVFTRTLDAPVCLRLTCRPVSTLTNRTIAVRFGKQTEFLSLTSNDAIEYKISFSSPDRAERLEFLLSKVGPASVVDTRRLGIALVSLSLSDGMCPSQ